MNTTPFRGRDAAQIEAKRAERLRDISEYAPRHLKLFKRAYAGKSLRAAVNAFCCECLGFAPSDEIAECTAPACPLFAVRPGRTRRKGAQ